MFLQKLDWVVFFLYVEWMKHHTARWGHVLKRQVLREYNRRARFTAMLACLAWPPACVAQARVSKQSHVASASQCAWVCSSQSQTIPVEPIRLGYFFSLVFVVSEIHGHEVTSNSSQAVSWWTSWAFWCHFGSLDSLWVCVRHLGRHGDSARWQRTDTLTDIDMKTSVALQRLHFCSGRWTCPKLRLT